MLLIWAGPLRAQSTDSAQLDTIVLDDFESYGVDALPVKWNAQLNGKLVPLTEQFVDDDEWFYVKREGRRQFVRAYANGEAVHIARKNNDGFTWDTTTHPILSWEWRANQLPEGAREDKESLNDSGAGMYIVFELDGRFIKRPKIIKYVYSSTLPVGTTHSYGKLKVIVVSSALDGIGRWKQVERNVVEDYQRVFGENPPNNPLYLRLWSDSDNTNSVASADFDNVEVRTR